MRRLIVPLLTIAIILGCNDTKVSNDNSTALSVSGAEEKTECTFVDIFNDVLDVADSKFKSRGIEVYKKFTLDEANKKFMANRGQLSQVLLNLLNKLLYKIQLITLLIIFITSYKTNYVQHIPILYVVT